MATDNTAPGRDVAPDAVPAVHVSQLVKRYGDMVALDYFDLDVTQGEIFGLLGPNGSGKTTAINCILALLTYDSGTIRVLGQPMTPTSYALKRRIGIVPQNVAVFNELTVTENIDYFCSLYVPGKADRAPLVEEAIEFVGLQDFRKFRPGKLSGPEFAEILQSDEFDRLLDQRCAIGFARHVQRAEVVDVFRDGQFVEYGHVLRHDADAPFQRV